MKTMLAALCLILGISLPCAAQDRPALHFSKAIEIDPLKQEELISVILDRDVYRSASEGFTDLRVYDKAGGEVPYVLEKETQARTQSQRKSAPASDVSLRELSGGGLEIQVSWDAKLPPAEGIRLITPLTNYQQRVQVSGRNDGQDWQPLVTDALVFDYSRYMDVSNQEIPLPQNRYRRFRITIGNVTSEQESQLLELTRILRPGQEAEKVERVAIERRPFRIDRIEFWYHVKEESRKEDKKTLHPFQDIRMEHGGVVMPRGGPARDGKPAAAGQKHETVVHVRAQREPLTGLLLESSSRNFTRRAAVQVPVTTGVRTDWREIGQATISQIDFRDLHRKELKISFPEHRSEEYRVVIDNRDNPLLQITGVQGEGSSYRLVFLGAPNSEYRLYYGSEVARAPHYDTAAVRESLARDYQPVLGRLGNEVADPSVVEPTEIRIRSLLNHSIVLGVMITLLVVVLAFVLYRANRRLAALPNDSEEKG
jgi:hypothetical protein